MKIIHSRVYFGGNWTHRVKEAIFREAIFVNIAIDGQELDCQKYEDLRNRSVTSSDPINTFAAMCTNGCRRGVSRGVVCPTS